VSGSPERGAPDLVAAVRHDPWRVFFPLAILLGWAGVFPWILWAAGLSEAFRAVFHGTTQIQGFLTALALGFLFTFVPRRTGTPPPSAATLAAGLIAPVAVSALAWRELVAPAQIVWALCIAAVAVFVGRRALGSSGSRRLPPVFAWVPVALVAGIGGAVAVAAAAVRGPREALDLSQLGEGLVTQGFVTALVVGVGGTMLPTLTRGEPAQVAPADGGGRVAHLAAALAFLASFPVEVYAAPRLGFALRAVSAGGVLAGVARLWRPPAVPGLHRRFIWIAAWLLPAGYLVAAIFPEQESAALHVTFIGCFALLALSVALHVVLSHAGQPASLAGRPWQVWCLGLLLVAATVFRLLVGVDPPRMTLWVALAAASFLLATLAWSALAVPALRAGASAG
jgi:uncharacterized protein involved in response to NO